VPMIEFSFCPVGVSKGCGSDIDQQVRQLNCGAPAEVLGLAPAQNSGARGGAICLPAIAFIPLV
jgi:hypothetical protein